MCQLKYNLYLLRLLDTLFCVSIEGAIEAKVEAEASFVVIEIIEQQQQQQQTFKITISYFTLC